MTFNKLITVFKNLNQDERGDIPVGPILIIGLIAIPMVIALIAFSDAILGYIGEKFDEFTNTEGTGADKFKKN